MNKTHNADYSAALDMLYLCGCALNGIVPSSNRISTLNFKELYAVSSFHKLTALVAAGLETRKAELPTDNEYCDRILASKDREFRKNIMFEMERDKICAFFEENGIWYMPLKGIILQSLYPKYGLRQMADNDILFDICYREKLRDFMVKAGYKICVYDEGKHDVYQKVPFYNFEMHVELFEKHENAVFHEYCKDIKSRLVHASERSCEYRFTDEDLYCYFLAHAYNHIDEAGIGVRFLCDLWVLIKAYSSAFNWTYIQNELRLLGIENFEKESRELVSAVFSNIEEFSTEQLSQMKYDLLIEIFESGTHGTEKQVVERGIAKKGGKFKYLLSCVFPETWVLESYLPQCKKYPWLRPIAWIWRIFCIVFGRTRHSVNKVKYIFVTKTD